jgi:hypothetical protein
MWHVGGPDQGGGAVYKTKVMIKGYGIKLQRKLCVSITLMSYKIRETRVTYPIKKPPTQESVKYFKNPARIRHEMTY